jgi:hypothetical protein
MFFQDELLSTVKTEHKEIDKENEVPTEKKEDDEVVPSNPSN